MKFQKDPSQEFQFQPAHKVSKDLFSFSYWINVHASKDNFLFDLHSSKDIMHRYFSKQLVLN